jgi:putative ABC transport system permease protein
MAWREAKRSRARSILVLVMIALPVLGVTAADIAFQTTEVSGAEALDRRLGAADARVSFQKGVDEVSHGFDPDDLGSSSGGKQSSPLRGLDDIRSSLADGVQGLQWLQSSGEMVTDKGLGYVEIEMIDLRDPLAEGIFKLDSGRPPAADDEIAINTFLAERGFELGDELELKNRGTYSVVGIGESTAYRDSPRLVGLSPELIGDQESRSSTWLVDAGPVSWSEVRELNAIGATVLSRHVMLDPPPESELPAELQSWGTGTDDALIAVAALVVVMALIEVVLLAGPAFAVGARRQSRTLALLAASGGTPRQARLVVLASGIVLGTLGAALGMVLGIAAAAAVLPVLQRFSGSWFGPFDVPWLHLVGIAAFGLLSAFLAALVPAWIASRQDVVAVLAGRRGDRPGGVRSPLIGALLLGAGVLGSAFGALGADSGEILIAASAIPAVLGMILLVPLVLTGLASASRRLPLTLRYAVRDAARHRTRTVPAVAAVAATVAGVVALGVANASDGAANEATYTPMLGLGHASVTAYRPEPGQWAQFRAVLDRELPAASVLELHGVGDETTTRGFRSVSFHLDGDEVPLEGWGGALGASVLVSDTAGREVLSGLEDAERARAQASLDAGGAVVYSSEALPEQNVVVRLEEYGPRGGKAEHRSSVKVPATFVQPDTSMALGQAVLSPAAADALRAEPQTVSLLVTSGVTEDEERDISEALAAISQDVGLYVERGYTADEETLILLLVLGGLGGLLMLGGTLTATFLALSDARPDLATLAAVGASPRARRRVAASYALVVGLVGALLGAAVGFVPGIAVTYPLTGDSWMVDSGQTLPTHYLDVPWLLIGALVLALPLLTALIVGLTARSRLPLVARLD